MTREVSPKELARRQNDKASIDAALRMRSLKPGPHFPETIHYFPGPKAYKWNCAGCDYYTGYVSKTKASKMIVAHCTTKNTERALACETPKETR